MKCKYCKINFKEWNYKEIKKGKVFKLKCPHCNKTNYTEKFIKITLDK